MRGPQALAARQSGPDFKTPVDGRELTGRVDASASVMLGTEIADAAAESQAAVLQVSFVGNIILHLGVLALFAGEDVPFVRGKCSAIELVAPNEFPTIFR